MFATGFFSGLQSPMQIPGCQLWYRADLGVTGTTTCSKWANQGLLGSAADMTQAISLGQPTIGTGLNGQSKLSFNTTQAFSIPTVGLSGPKTVIYVLKLLATPHTGFSLYTLMQDSVTFSEEILDLSSALFNVFTVDSVLAGINSIGNNTSISTSTGTIMTHTYNGVLNTAAVNYNSLINYSTVALSTSSIITRLTGTQGSFGGRLSTGLVTFGINADIYEFMVFNRVLSDTEIMNMYIYLRIRYGL